MHVTMYASNEITNNVRPFVRSATTHMCDVTAAHTQSRTAHGGTAHRLATVD